jgi:hypothetical protein
MSDLLKPAESGLSRRLLLLAASRSDLVEMGDLAVQLAQRKHRVVLAYVREGKKILVPSDIKARLQSLGCNGGQLKVAVIDDVMHSLDSSVFTAATDDTGAQPKLGPFGRIDQWLEMLGIRHDLSARHHRFFFKCIQYGRSVFNRIRRTVRASLSKLSKAFSEILSPVRAAYLIIEYTNRLGTFRKILCNQSYDALIIPEDIVGPVWPLVVKAANDLAIPCLVVPYTLANQTEAIQSLKDEAVYQSSNNRLAAWLAPNWRYKQDGIDLVRLPAAHIAAHLWLKISPPDPWLMNSGYASAICVDSKASHTYFERAGIAASALVVTGSVSQDKLFTAMQAKSEQLQVLRQELGLLGNKPLLLISGCPNQLAGKVPHCEFATMKEVADHLGQSLAALASTYHLVVRPHPNFMAFGEMLQPWGIVSTNISTACLVPLADVFVAFASATIRWSVACAVPTINYDIFNYGYDDFSSAKGVVTVTNAAEFEDVILIIQPESDAYRRLKTLIAEDSADWSMMDGRGVERIEAVIEAALSKARH